MSTDTLALMVCPHDTASNPDRWFMFMQYLAQKLGIHLQFDISLDFNDFRDNLAKADLVYANPTDTVSLLDQGFTAVARPADLFDETIFLASPTIDGPSLEDIAGKPFAGVRGLLPTKIALHILEERGITPSEVVDCESWTGVVGSIWREEYSYGLIYKDTYDELSEQGKGMVNAFFTSEEKVAFHSFVVGRNGSAHQETIQRALLEMHQDEQGKEVLQELHFETWADVPDDKIAKMRQIINSYC